MNLDVKDKLVEEAKAAIESGNIENFVNGVANYVDNIKEEVLKDYAELKNETDRKILESRGYKALTSNEVKFYDNFVANAKNQSIADVPLAIPEETFNRVFDDLVTRHPLLSHIDFINTKALTNKIVMNTGITGVAGWGELCATIDDEIESGFAIRAIDMNKLSAYMELCKPFLDLGYEWLDRYVRLCLGEAVALALEGTIINGTGSSMPIGYTKELADLGEEQTIPAEDKDAQVITDLSAATLGGIAAQLTDNGKKDLGKMIMIVNPVDYYGKVIPATRIMNAAGQWVEYLPFPVEFVPSVKMTANSAVFARDFSYQMLVGLGREGRIERSNDYKFYEDLTCYKVKLVGGGLPKDNTAVVADITNLKPTFFNVKVVEEEVSA